MGAAAQMPLISFSMLSGVLKLAKRQTRASQETRGLGRGFMLQCWP